MRRPVLGVLAFVAVFVSGPALRAEIQATQTPIVYRVTFPEPEHHWLQVEVTFAGLGAAPLKARMSRSSPGRYATHEFAKNVFQVDAFNGAGRKLSYTRPDPDEWDVAGHDGTVRLVYKIFGDHADGTYMGVDTTHAHLNMPATFMWAMGLELRPMRVTFVPPTGTTWKIGTQLYATNDPQTFTAPNLQYFMDSPTELSDFVLSTFTVPNSDGTPSQFRIVAHSDGTQDDVDELAKMVQRLVREQMAVYGEFPKYEPGYYTFLLDYVRWGDGDGMEHRNSTSISQAGLSLRTAQGRRQALSTISHEFFHNWNVERIRPQGIEPFDFTRENITCCLWVAEGFTQYYGPLLLTRAGLGSPNPPTNNALQVITGSGRLVRSAVQMSEYAPFADAGVANDATDARRTFISYYTYGAAIALGLDLSLRNLPGGKLTLDDYMRLLWQRHGKVVDSRPGYVAKPYSLKDLRDMLAELTGNKPFADEFFDKYVEGREVVDYAKLLLSAGYVLKSSNPDGGWVGRVQVQEGGGGITVTGLVPFGTPAYDAGLDTGDVVTTIAGDPATAAAWNGLSRRKPGDTVPITIRRRDGKTEGKTLAIKADPSLVVEAVENGGGELTAAQKAMREAWLGSKVK
jgi:predicted metalloprotease with PDZ domain